MPLKRGSGVYADRWKVVQMTFKAKPAFSVKKYSEDFSRPVLVFGVNSFTGVKTSNYDGCHYVHYSHVGNNQHFSGLWDLETKGVNEIHSTANIPSGEPSLKDSFFIALFSNNSGVFELAFRHGSSTDLLLDRIARLNDGTVLQAPSLHMFVKGTFMGCVDCNAKMTISEYIEPLFGMLFSEDMYSPKSRKKKKSKDASPLSTSDPMNDTDSTITVEAGSRPSKRTPTADGFDTEIMLHYIMLSGLVKTDDRVDNHSNPGPNERYFRIPDPRRRRVWVLKCIMMWCSLQILFCSWKMAGLYDGLRHHTNYIYRGVMDFYLSMWLYALYSLFTYDKIGSLTFDEFHYYYSSMMPFFMHKNRGYNGSFNLCALILSEANIGAEKFPDGSTDKLNDVQQSIEVIFNRVTAFWNGEMEAVCLGIHSLIRGGVPKQLDSFFILILDVEARRRRLLGDDVALDIDTFCGLLTPRWYWFHFRYITMAVIQKTSLEYLGKPGMPPEAQQLWLNWCSTFDARVQTLNVRMYLKQKNDLIRLRSSTGYRNKNV